MTDHADHGDPGTSPTRQRQRLRALLVQLRGKLSQEELGRRIGMGQPTVSRLESGRRLPSPEEARAWADAVGADEDARQQLLDRLDAAYVETTSFADALRDGFAANQLRISTVEQTASLIRTYTPMFVPGLLQTAEYARRLIAMQALWHHGQFGDLEEALASWMQRQQVLYQPGPPRLHFLIPEYALRWRPGPDASPMLVQQAHHLVTASTLPTVRFGVIPEEPGARVCVPHSFRIEGDSDRDEQVEVSVYTTTRPIPIREPSEVRTYLNLWEALREQAVFDDAVRALLARVAASLTA